MKKKLLNYVNNTGVDQYRSPLSDSCVYNAASGLHLIGLFDWIQLKALPEADSFITGYSGDSRAVWTHGNVQDPALMTFWGGGNEKV